MLEPGFFGDNIIIVSFLHLLLSWSNIHHESNIHEVWQI